MWSTDWLTPPTPDPCMMDILSACFPNASGGADAQHVLLWTRLRALELAGISESFSRHSLREWIEMDLYMANQCGYQSV